MRSSRVRGTETWTDTVSGTAGSVGSDKVMVLTGYRHSFVGMNTDVSVLADG